MAGLMRLARHALLLLELPLSPPEGKLTEGQPHFILLLNGRLTYR